MISCSCAIANTADKSPPNAALLEFLGDSVQVGKDRVDPLSMQSMQEETAQHQSKQSTDASAQTESPDSAKHPHRRSAHE